jgi:hypothetical protein
MSNVNSELFLQIAERIERDPKCYDQEYVCREPGQWGGCIFCHAEEILKLPHFTAGWASRGNVPNQATAEALGLGPEEANILHHSKWKPRAGLTVPAALRLIADGKSVSEVSA